VSHAVGGVTAAHAFMTEAQATEIIAMLEDTNFMLYCVTLCVGFIWGALTWLIIVYGMKARSILG